MEHLEPDIRPICPPDPPDPFNPWSKFEPILKYAYRLKKSRWYIPFLAALAFVAGYFLFLGIARLEGMFVHPDSLVGFQERDLVYMAFIEQAVLGVAVFFFFALSRTYQLTLFIYAGFLTYHVQLITERITPNDPLLFLLTPVFLYAFTGLLVTLGLLFNKRLGVLFLVVSISILAQHNTQILLGHNLSIRGIFFSSWSEQPTTQETFPIKQPVEEITAEDNASWADSEDAVKETSPIQWRSLDAELPPIRVLRNSDLKSNFCFYHIGDITSGEYASKKATLATVQVDTPCDTLRPLKSYGYVIADAAGNILAWKDDYLYLQYEEECEDRFDYGGACNPANYRRYLGLLDSSIDSLPFPPELTRLTQGYIFTKESPNRALFRVTDTDFYTLFPLDISDTADTAFEFIDSTEGGAKIVRKTKTISVSAGVFQNSYYLLLPFGRALELERVP